MKFFAGFIVGAIAGRPVIKVVKTHVVPRAQRQITGFVNAIYAWSEGYLTEHDRVQKENAR